MYQRGENKQTFEYNWKNCLTLKKKKKKSKDDLNVRSGKTATVKWRDDQRSGEIANEVQRVKGALKA